MDQKIELLVLKSEPAIAHDGRYAYYTREETIHTPDGALSPAGADWQHIQFRHHDAQVQCWHETGKPDRYIAMRHEVAELVDAEFERRSRVERERWMAERERRRALWQVAHDELTAERDKVDRFVRAPWWRRVWMAVRREL